MTKKKYDVVILRIDRKHNNGFRYEIHLSWGEHDEASFWTYTLWGARHKAKKMVTEHRKPLKTPRIVEEYKL